MFTASEAAVLVLLISVHVCWTDVLHLWVNVTPNPTHNSLGCKQRWRTALSGIHCAVIEREAVN